MTIPFKIFLINRMHFDKVKYQIFMSAPHDNVDHPPVNKLVFFQFVIIYHTIRIIQFPEK